MPSSTGPAPVFLKIRQALSCSHRCNGSRTQRANDIRIRRPKKQMILRDESPPRPPQIRTALLRNPKAQTKEKCTTRLGDIDSHNDSQRLELWLPPSPHSLVTAFPICVQCYDRASGTA